MTDILSDYLRALIHYWVLIVLAVMPFNNIWKWLHKERKDLPIPHWVRVAISVAALIAAPFLAYRDQAKNLDRIIQEKRQAIIERDDAVRKSAAQNLQNVPAIVPKNQPQQITRAQQLCPYAVPYTIRALNPPEHQANINYASEIVVRKAKEPMFHISIHQRARLWNAQSDDGQVAMVNYGGIEVVDVVSDKPRSTFKVTLTAFDAIRVDCVNQDN